MEKVDIFKDIAERTGGDIYFGVVGAVRTGKSTFIKKFMELVVIPNIENESDRQRAQDELPQSAAGRTIMTTEPKFVPNQAVSIEVDEGLEVNIRLVDCVGYTVPGAKGYEDENVLHLAPLPSSEGLHSLLKPGTRITLLEVRYTHLFLLNSLHSSQLLGYHILLINFDVTAPYLDDMAVQY